MNKRDRLITLDDELSLIKDSLAQLSQSGLPVTPIWVANILVAFKSKPLILLVGPPESAKEVIVESFFSILTGTETYQYQTMIGHPWWAAQTLDVVTYTMAQSRLNTLKLECMIEEARLPENRDRLFIAELIKISPGELQEYFIEMAFQLKHGQLMRLPTAHFSEPISFPANMSIIGTMDTIKFNWLDHDLLSKASIIDCPPGKLRSIPSLGTLSRYPDRQKILIQHSIRDPQRAFGKLFGMLRGLPSALLPFFQVKQLLQKSRSIHFTNSLFEGIIYLANSWSYTGRGLFSGNRRKNLQIALDLAITQSLLLPCSEKISQSKNLQIKLHKVLGEQFPNASAYINQLIPA